MIFPFVFVFFASLMWLIEIFRIHSLIGGIVNETGCKTVNYSYSYQFEGLATVITLLDIKDRITKSDVGSKITELICIPEFDPSNNEVSIKVSYRINPIVKVPGYSGIVLTNSFYSKGYLGNTNNRTESEYVYITKDSEVYHRGSNCVRLKRDVIEISEDKLQDYRNMDRKKYYKCSKCSNKEKNGNVYITPYGERYHYSIECSEIVVGIYKIPIGEIGDKRQCYFCE